MNNAEDLYKKIYATYLASVASKEELLPELNGVYVEAIDLNFPQELQDFLLDLQLTYNRHGSFDDFLEVYSEYAETIHASKNQSNYLRDLSIQLKSK